MLKANEILADKPQYVELGNEYQEMHPMNGNQNSDSVNGYLSSNKIKGIIESLKSGTKQPKLKDIFSDPEILSLCEIPQFKQRLWHTLPASLRDSDESLEQIVKSPAFRQSLELFEDALCSGEMNSVILSLGLDPSAGSSFGGVKRLLQSIKQKVNLEKLNPKK